MMCYENKIQCQNRMREGETIEVKLEISATAGEKLIITLKLCSETNNHAVHLRKQF